MSGIQASDRTRIEAVLPCFKGLPQESWERAELVEAGPGTPHDIREGHLFRHALFVVSGCIRVYKISPGGREITLYRVRDGECCVLMMASILGELEYEASAAVETDARLLLLPVEDFRVQLERLPPLRKFVYGQFVTRVTDVSRLLEQVAFHPLPCRVSDFLLRESEKNAVVTVTHERLAVELGTAREAVTRVLKDLALRGAVQLGRGRITVLERGVLLELVREER